MEERRPSLTPSLHTLYSQVRVVSDGPLRELRVEARAQAPEDERLGSFGDSRRRPPPQLRGDASAASVASAAYPASLTARLALS